MKIFANVICIGASVASIILWIIFIFFNPYDTGNISSDLFFRTFMMLLLPALLALGATVTFRKVFLFIAFIWSLPMSIYLALTPGIFAFFALTSIGYLFSYLLLKINDKKSEQYLD